MVKDGEVIIVDKFTGRLMPGRRWSDGLHQAIEAKEGVSIRKEDQTLATITFQNYFRLYKKLSGMTGTAETEAAEFEKIYKLEIVVIPTNKPLLRVENPDVVFRTAKEKYKAVADDISALHEKKQPVLVGTTSIEKSELLSGILARKGVRHVVLNAKFHEREAEIVAQAGRLGMVTIATNMAGRGTDILLGGNAEFMARQELVKKARARALSVAEGAINPMAPRLPALLLPGPGVRNRRAGMDRDFQGSLRGSQRRARTGHRSGRPLHPRHRAPRVAAHRQPAAWPRRPPGRSRRVALLSLA